MVPRTAMTEQKRKYSECVFYYTTFAFASRTIHSTRLISHPSYRKDLKEWARFWRAVEKQAGEDLSFVDGRFAITWSSFFPFRTVVALRIAILDERVIGTICEYF